MDLWPVAVVIATSTTIVVAGVIIASHVLSAPPVAFETAAAQTVTNPGLGILPTVAALVAGILWVLYALLRGPA